MTWFNCFELTITYYGKPSSFIPVTTCISLVLCTSSFNNLNFLDLVHVYPYMLGSWEPFLYLPNYSFSCRFHYIMICKLLLLFLSSQDVKKTPKVHFALDGKSPTSTGRKTKVYISNFLNFLNILSLKVNLKKIYLYINNTHWLCSKL